MSHQLDNRIVWRTGAPFPVGKPTHCRLCTIILSHATPEQRPAVGHRDLCQWCCDHYGPYYVAPRPDCHESRNLQADLIKLEILDALNLINQGLLLREVAHQMGVRQTTLSKRFLETAPEIFGGCLLVKNVQLNKVTDFGKQLLKEYGYV